MNPFDPNDPIASRFTNKVRMAVTLAEETARSLGEGSITGGHVLLGVAGVADWSVLYVLSRFGVAPADIADSLAAAADAAHLDAVHDMQWTADSLDLLQKAASEADLLGDKSIDCVHLLLALIRSGPGIAGRVLNGLQIQYADAITYLRESRNERDRSSGRARASGPEGSKRIQLGDRDIPVSGRGTHMWQRFTERARKVVFYAQEEAGRLGENYVSTEHLALGLTRENDSVAASILDRLGISLGRIRSEIERQVTHGDGRLGQDMQLTPRAKRVIDLAYDEARRLNNNWIGTEHILLGLIREGEGLAGRVFTTLGVDIETVRAAARSLPDRERAVAKEESAVPTIGLSKSVTALLSKAYVHAASASKGRVEVADVAAALLDDAMIGHLMEMLETYRSRLEALTAVTDPADESEKPAHQIERASGQLPHANSEEEPPKHNES